MKSLSLSACLVLSLFGLFSAEAYAEENTVAWAAFRSSLFVAVQPSQNYALGPSISWNPRYNIANGLAFGGNFGVLALKNTYGSIFSAAEYQVTGAYALSPALAIEAGLGGHYWADPEGGANAPSFSTNLVHRLDDESAFKCIFGGVTLVAMPSDTTFIVRLGLGF